MFSCATIEQLERADCIIGHSFGTSTGPDGVNSLIASFMLEIADDRPIIADRTLVEATPGKEEVVSHVIEGPVINHRAEGVGTWGVLVQSRDYMETTGLKLPIMVGQTYHVPRIVKQAAKLGMDSLVPPNLPHKFDPKSDQIWTRSLLLWMPANAIGSLLLRYRGQL